MRLQGFKPRKLGELRCTEEMRLLRALPTGTPQGVAFGILSPSRQFAPNAVWGLPALGRPCEDVFIHPESWSC